MVKAFLKTSFRILGWLLVIVGVLFTILQAYLVGLPALLIGGFLLWRTTETGLTTYYPAKPTYTSMSPPLETTEDRYLMARNKFERHHASSACFVPDDSDPRNPLFRTFPDRPENDN